MIWVIAGVALAAVVVVLVSLPFLREPETIDDRLDAPTEAEEQRLALIEERDRTLAALKELEFDHRAGTIGDEDYRTLIGPLRQAAAAALRALDDAQRSGLPPVPASAFDAAHEEADHPDEREDDRHPDQELDHGEAEDEEGDDHEQDE